MCIKVSHKREIVPATYLKLPPCACGAAGPKMKNGKAKKTLPFKFWCRALGNARTGQDVSTTQGLAPLELVIRHRQDRGRRPQQREYLTRSNVHSMQA